MSAPLERIQAIVDDVLDLHAGEIGTHYDDCWKRHVGCLASLISSHIKEES